MTSRAARPGAQIANAANGSGPRDLAVNASPLLERARARQVNLGLSTTYGVSGDLPLKTPAAKAAMTPPSITLLYRPGMADMRDCRLGSMNATPTGLNDVCCASPCTTIAENGMIFPTQRTINMRQLKNSAAQLQDQLSRS